jgi:hypothetical protein
MATTANDIGQFVSVVVPPDGRPVAAYYDDTANRLEVARCGNAACSTGNVRAIVDVGMVGEYLSVTLSTAGNPVISYYDANTTSLRVAVCSNPQCSSLAGGIPAVADNVSDVGQYTSVQIGADGFPIIAHYSASLGDLRLTDCANLTCTSAVTTIADATGDVGRHVSMALRDGLPVIAYQDVTNGDLKLAECEDTACESRSLRVVDANGTFAAPTGLYSSLALRPDGTAVIAYSTSAGALLLADTGNQPPLISLPAPYDAGSVMVDAGETVVFTLDAGDSDNLPAQSLTFGFVGTVPNGTALDTVSGAFEWTPTAAQRGTHVLVFGATDSGTPPRTGYVTLTVIVEAANAPPTISAPGVLYISEGSAYTFAVTADDPDPGQTSTVGVGNLPDGATFDSLTGQFEWTPSAAQVGMHVVSFSATDDFPFPASVSASTVIWVDDQLVANGGFEQGADVPDQWTLKKPKGDVYDCVSLAYEGSCAFTFTGAKRKLTTLRQTVDPAWIDSGDAVTLSLRVKTINAVKTRVGLLKVVYVNGSIQTAKVSLAAGTTGGWTLLTAPPLTLNTPVRSLRLTLAYTGKRGTVSIDAVSVLVRSANGDPTRTDRVLPPPSAPDGFRR